MNLIVFFLVIAIITDVYIMFYSITRKDNSRSVYFVMLSGASALYAVGEMFLQMSKTTAGVMTALKVVNMGVPFLAPCFLLIALSLFQPKYLNKSWMMPAVVIYGLLVFFVVVFNDSHMLFYRVAEFDPCTNFALIEHGPLFWINQFIVLLCMNMSYIILLGRFAKGNGRLRHKMIFIIIGSLLPYIADILKLTNVLPERIDLLPLVMPVALIFYTVDAAKYKLWDGVSVASDTVLETMEDAVIMLDNDWYFLSCNQKAKALFPSLAKLEFLFESEPVMNSGAWPSELEKVNELNEIVFELEKSEPYNQKSTYRANTNKIIDRKGLQIGWYIVMHDTTSITYLVNQLESLATTDPLTGIANRRHFLERVNSEMDRSARINMSNALVMYDIDLFKKVNDIYGHAAGDYILCAVVDTIRKQLRSYDILARYGGEEFMIFTPSIDDDLLYKFANRLCRAIENSVYIYKNIHIPVTASFGAVQVNRGDNFDDALIAVDEAMYKAKHNGRNQVVVGKIKKR